MYTITLLQNTRLDANNCFSYLYPRVQLMDFHVKDSFPNMDFNRVEKSARKCISTRQDLCIHWKEGVDISHHSFSKTRLVRESNLLFCAWSRKLWSGLFVLFPSHFSYKPYMELDIFLFDPPGFRKYIPWTRFDIIILSAFSVLLTKVIYNLWKNQFEIIGNQNQSNNTDTEIGKNAATP